VHCGTWQRRWLFNCYRHRKDRMSSPWVAVPQILLQTSITSCLIRQLILNIVFWYKCLLSIHGTVSSRETPVLIIKHGNAVEAHTSALVKDVVSNASLIKTDTVIKTFWTHADMKLKKWGNFTGWWKSDARRTHRFPTECYRYHYAVCSYCNGTPARISRKFSFCF